MAPKHQHEASKSPSHQAPHQALSNSGSAGPPFPSFVQPREYHLALNAASQKLLSSGSASILTVTLLPAFLSSYHAMPSVRYGHPYDRYSMDMKPTLIFFFQRRKHHWGTSFPNVMMFSGCMAVPSAKSVASEGKNPVLRSNAIWLDTSSQWYVLEAAGRSNIIFQVGHLHPFNRGQIARYVLSSISCIHFDIVSVWEVTATMSVLPLSGEGGIFDTLIPFLALSASSPL